MSNASFLSSYYEQLTQRPYAYDWYAVLRQLENHYPLKKPLGRNLLPAHEPIRLGQHPSLAFAPATLQRVTYKNQQLHVHIASFGLFGPNGALPLHLTEYAYQRLHHHHDATFTQFANLFHHRLISLFYRAWADNQCALSLDHPTETFSHYVAQLARILYPPQGSPELIAPHARLYFSGLLAQSRRNAAGLVQVLRDFFTVPVQLQNHIPQWISLPKTQQWRLGTGVLGEHPLGKKYYDAQYKFRLQLGPLSYGQFHYFLPTQRGYLQLRQWVQDYIGLELAWELQLILQQHEVQGVRLGKPQPLGLATWLGQRPKALGHAKDVII